MNQKSDIDAIRELATSSEKRSKIGRLRAIFHEIENAKAAGVSNNAIVDVLNKQGYDLNLKTFESMVYRIRKERKEKPNKPMAIMSQDNTPKKENKTTDNTQQKKGEIQDATALFADLATKHQEGKYSAISKKDYD